MLSLVVCFFLALTQLMHTEAFIFNSAIIRDKSLHLSQLHMGLKVECSEDEPIESILRRFKRSVNQSGHLMELRNKEQWETALDKRKRKTEKARLMKRIERTNDRFENKAFGGSEYSS